MKYRVNGNLSRNSGVSLYCAEIEADSPKEAAQEALDIHRSIADAAYFEVEDALGNKTVIDFNIAE
jgi:hypothetical protein